MRSFRSDVAEALVVIVIFTAVGMGPLYALGAVADGFLNPEDPTSWGASSPVVYWLATHRAAPDVIVGVSLFGYVYLSEDGGQNWRKLDREFGEVRSVTVTAN